MHHLMLICTNAIHSNVSMHLTGQATEKVAACESDQTEEPAAEKGEHSEVEGVCRCGWRVMGGRGVIGPGVWGWVAVWTA